MNTLLVILLLCLTVSTYIAVIQYTKSEKLQKIVDILATNMNSISSIIEEADEILSSDSLKEAFDHDDEVGTFFKQLKEIQEILNQFELQNEKER